MEEDFLDLLLYQGSFCGSCIGSAYNWKNFLQNLLDFLLVFGILRTCHHSVCLCVRGLERECGVVEVVVVIISIINISLFVFHSFKTHLEVIDLSLSAKVMLSTAAMYQSTQHMLHSS